MRINIGIIILNYKTPDLVIDCLSSLVDQIEPDIKVVVVDNASEDGSVERINEQIDRNNWHSWAEVLSSPVNGGFSAGNNLGIQAVEADAYILLNSDTIVLPNAIKELRYAMRISPKAGLIAPACVNHHNGKDRNTFHFIHPVSELIRGASTGLITRLLKKYIVPFKVNESPAEPDWVGFACVLIRREVIDQIGLLDDGYFMYFEDVDYCHRVRHTHWSVLYWPNAEIIHLLGGSSQFTAKQGVQTRAPRYFYEARARYFAKHYGRIGLISANIMWLVGHSIARMRQMLGNKNPHHRKKEVRDIWINALHPFRLSSISTDK